MIVGVVCGACMAEYECKIAPFGCGECGRHFSTTSHCVVERKDVGKPHVAWRANYYGVASEALIDKVTAFILSIQRKPKMKPSPAWADVRAAVNDMWALCPCVPSVRGAR